MDAYLIRNVICCAISLVIVAITSVKLFPRAFPTALYLPTDSAVRYLAIRCRLLFLMACLILVDIALNVIYMIESASSPSSSYPRFLRQRVAWSLIHLPQEDVLVMATAMRCAAIVLHGDQSRRRYLVGVGVLCFLVRATTIVLNMRVVLDASATPLHVRDLIPLSTPTAMALEIVYPLILISGSVWSLRAARSSSSSSSKAPSTSVAPPSTVSATHSAAHSAISATNKNTLATTTGSTRIRGMHYKFSRAFVLLTLVECGLWVLVISVGLATTRQQIPVSQITPAAVLELALTLLAESSFEAILRVERSRARTRTLDVDRYMESLDALDDYRAAAATAKNKRAGTTAPCENAHGMQPVVILTCPEETVPEMEGSGGLGFDS
ncbi:hypothetical protein BC828DRAFT_372531 [Blastocladiella britannica]|nr:hypothetical protein BC828DRAFT_372531 [Blastocladiella britannica]